MAIDTRKPVTRKDNRTVWTIFAIVVLAILAYAAYAAYRNSDYAMQADTAAVTPQATENAQTMPDTNATNRY